MCQRVSGPVASSYLHAAVGGACDFDARHGIIDHVTKQVVVGEAVSQHAVECVAIWE